MSVEPPPIAVQIAQREPLLSVQDLHVEFRIGRGTVRAVRGISLEVNRGETVAIIGESGSGKSVTARAILGIIQSPPGFISRGAIVYNGTDLLKMGVRQRRSLLGDRISMVFQDALAALNPLYSVGWQISELFRFHRGMSKKDARKRSVELLSRVGIPDPESRIDQLAHQFSGGMRQRVMIAMAIALGPELLLADEPTTALDVTVQAQVLQLLARLKAELGMALVMITHNVAVAAEIADRVAVMYAGRIVETGTAIDILTRPSHPYSRALVALAIGTGDKAGKPIPGSPPDLIKPSKGCAFRARCAMARDICGVADPALRPIRDGQLSACHFAEEVWL